MPTTNAASYRRTNPYVHGIHKTERKSQNRDVSGRTAEHLPLAAQRIHEDVVQRKGAVREGGVHQEGADKAGVGDKEEVRPEGLEAREEGEDLTGDYA